MNRRDFLKLIGRGAAAAAVPVVAEPFVRRVWSVPSNAPVGQRIERVGSTELSFDHGYTYDPSNTALALNINDESFVWDDIERELQRTVDRTLDGVTLYTPRGPVQVLAYSDQSPWAVGRCSYIITSVDTKARTVTLSREDA